jgi:hypothetical protein
VRLENGLQAVLGTPAGDVEVRSANPEDMPTLRCVLARPATSKASLLLQVHSRAGIPLAAAVVGVAPGDRAFETPPLAMLAMEGYAHLAPGARRAVERRVWSRRAYVTVTAA